MKYFWLKIGLFCFSVVIFIGCWLFLFLNQADNLARFVPAEAEMYLHLKPNTASKIPQKHLKLYLAWLAKHSNLSEDNWKSLAANVNQALGCFTINGQIFCLTKQTPELTSLLSGKNISFTKQKIENTSDSIIFFPEIKTFPERLTGQAWFNEIKTKINFSKFTLYLKNLTYLNLSSPSTDPEYSRPISLLGRYRHDKLRLKVNGMNIKQTWPSAKQRLSTFPVVTNFYGYNLNSALISEKADYLPENFKFHLLKAINGPVEFLDLGAEYIVYFSKKTNNIEQLKARILSILAYTSPSEKIKYLPDDSTSTQYIADPTAWKYETVVINNQQTQKLIEPKINLSLAITEINDYYRLANNENTSIKQPLTNSRSLFSSCSRFGKKIGLYINPKNTPYSTYLDNIVIINSTFTGIAICID